MPHCAGMPAEPENTPEIDIVAAAKKAKSVTVDGQSIQRHDLSQLQEAQDRIAANQAVRSRRGGLRITKLRPPGSI